MEEAAYLEEIIDYVRNCTIIKRLPALKKAVQEHFEYEKNAVYSHEIFVEHLKYVKEVSYLDDIISTIERCIEYGLKQQLIILLDNIDHLLEIANHKDGVKILDKRMLLRKLDVECYLIARKCGFIDHELEKRIICIQKIWKQRKLKDKQKVEINSYEGPTPEEYEEFMVISKQYNNPRYWGYRHTLYLLKWNRIKRYKILKRILVKWWGDCRYQAYIDYLEPNNEDVIDKYSQYKNTVN